MKKYLVEYTDNGGKCRIKFINASTKEEATQKAEKKNIYDITDISSNSRKDIKDYIFAIGCYNANLTKQSILYNTL